MARIIVIGGANVDIKGRSSEELERGTSNPGQVTVSAGGVGRNIAENLARLGVETALITSIGADAHGEMVRAATAAAGVHVAAVETGDAPTGAYLAILTDQGEMLSAINDMRTADAVTPERVAGCLAELGGADFLVADCNLPQDTLQFVFDEAARRNTRLLIEPVSIYKLHKLIELKLSRPLDYATPNRYQITALTVRKKAREAIAVMHERGIANLAVHSGDEGAYVSDGVRFEHVKPLFTGQPADVTGAGDAAVAGLVFGLVSGRNLFQATKIGQAAAAIKLASNASVAADMTRDRVMALAGLST